MQSQFEKYGPKKRRKNNLKEVPIIVLSESEDNSSPESDSEPEEKMRRYQRNHKEAKKENIIVIQPPPQPAPMPQYNPNPYMGMGMFPPGYWHPQMFVASAAPVIAKSIGPMLVGETPRTVRTYWYNDFTKLPHQTYRSHRNRDTHRSQNYQPRESYRQMYRSSPDPFYTLRDYPDQASERPPSNHFYYDQNGDILKAPTSPHRYDGWGSRPKSRHYFYGPNGKLLSGPPRGYKNPEPHSGLPNRLPMNSDTYSTDDEMSEFPKNYTVVGELEFGHLKTINDEITTRGITGLPKAIRDELYTVYGHISKCEAMIMATNGRYTIQVKVPEEARVTLAKPVRGTSVWQGFDDDGADRITDDWKQRIQAREDAQRHNDLKQEEFNLMMKKFIENLNMKDQSQTDNVKTHFDDEPRYIPET